MSARLRVIRTPAEREKAMLRIHELMAARQGTPEGDELEVLAKLVEDYEASSFPVALPSPVEAIRFRMDQKGLGPRDLEPILGSRARVSQVLNGTRPLSIDMIRAVHRHLGISAEVLIGSEPVEAEADRDQELSRPAAKRLRALGLLGATETFHAFAARAFGRSAAAAMFRKTRTPRTNAKTDLIALRAWCAAALVRSQAREVAGTFSRDRFDAEVLRRLARLSRDPDGPLKAVRLLSEEGIALVILPHLPGTHLDGAAMMRADGVPVIALTLRRDRIDNFWFTLLHECVHVARHLENEDMIFDDLEIGSDEDMEREADREAGRALIPDQLWGSFNSGAYCSLAQLQDLARAAQVDPAIVAGRWQNENRDFRKFSKLLGHGEIRARFPDAGFENQL